MGIKSIALAAGLAALTVLGGIASAKEVDMNLTELRRLFVGNTLVMEFNGRITRQYTSRDGSVTQKFDAGGQKIGSWEIRGSRNPRICYDFPGAKSKCFIAFSDELTDYYFIYKYRNKRKDKLVFRVNEIQSGNRITPPPPMIEESVQLSRKMVRRVQARLNKRGFNAGKVDGVMGNKTRGAIADYQNFIDQPETGELTEDQLDRLLN